MRVYKELSDKELFLFFQTEEPAAFTEIYRRYHSLLYIYAHKKLNNKEEAQDVVQEVLTALWRNRSTCYLEGSLAWIKANPGKLPFSQEEMMQLLKDRTW